MSVTELINTIRGLLSARPAATSNVTLWYKGKKVFADEVKVDATGIHVNLTEFN